jgi:hypothetical protein
MIKSQLLVSVSIFSMILKVTVMFYSGHFIALRSIYNTRRIHVTSHAIHLILFGF